MLSLVLLMAQLGMQAHAYSHLQPEKQSVPAAIQHCGECLSFAPMLGMAGNSHSVFLSHASLDRYCAPADVSLPAQELITPAFRSRAPPQVP